MKQPTIEEVLRALYMLGDKATYERVQAIDNGASIAKIIKAVTEENRIKMAIVALTQGT